MKEISSSLTVYYKKIIPSLWFFGLWIFFMEALFGGAYDRDPFVIVGPFIMAALGFFVMKKLVFDLADEVRDGGDFLMVKKNGAEAKISIENIMHVNVSTFTNPQRVTLRFVTPEIFGNEVTFSPKSKFSINPFAKNEIAESLIERVYSAKQKIKR